MRVRGFVTAVAVGAMSASMLLAAPGQATGPVKSGTTSVTAGGERFDRLTDNQKAADAMAGDTKYWTKERMATATPLDVAAEATTATLTGQTAAGVPMASTGRIKQRRVPKTAGKLFFQIGRSNYVCSASTVYNPRRPKKKSVVVTAGHCVTSGTQWHRNFLYVPKYRNGRTPYGVWRAKEAVTYRAFRRQTDYNRDMAFLKMRPRKGKQIAKVTGGNRLRYGMKRYNKWTRIIGWPAERANGRRYNGELPVQCKGRTVGSRSFPGDAVMRCPMTGGASGGPWYRKMLSRNHGTVYAVTSRRTLSGPPRLLATPFPRSFKRMYNKF